MRFIVTALIAFGSLGFLTPKSEDLLNTTWSGKLNVPDPVDAEMEFRKDSLFIYLGPELVETTSFKVKEDTLVLQKISGMSSCDLESADYRYTINNDVLVLEALKDNCAERKTAFSTEGFKKIK